MPHRPGHRPNGREGAPNPREGSNGDIQLKQSLHLGAKLYGKVSGSWHDIPLSLNGVTRIGTTYSNHLAISSDKLEFMKGSKSMLSIISSLVIPVCAFIIRICVRMAGSSLISACTFAP